MKAAVLLLLALARQAIPRRSIAKVEVDKILANAKAEIAALKLSNPAEQLSPTPLTAEGKSTPSAGNKISKEKAAAAASKVTHAAAVGVGVVKAGAKAGVAKVAAETKEKLNDRADSIFRKKVLTTLKCLFREKKADKKCKSITDQKVISKDDLPREGNPSMKLQTLMWFFMKESSIYQLETTIPQIIEEDERFELSDGAIKETQGGLKRQEEKAALSTKRTKQLADIEAKKTNKLEEIGETKNMRKAAKTLKNEALDGDETPGPDAKEAGPKTFKNEAEDGDETSGPDAKEAGPNWKDHASAWVRTARARTEALKDKAWVEGGASKNRNQAAFKAENAREKLYTKLQGRIQAPAAAL